jgi:hypothetical protein
VEIGRVLVSEENNDGTLYSFDDAYCCVRTCHSVQVTAYQGILCWFFIQRVGVVVGEKMKIPNHF